MEKSYIDLRTRVKVDMDRENVGKARLANIFVIKEVKKELFNFLKWFFPPLYSWATYHAPKKKKALKW